MAAPLTSLEITNFKAFKKLSVGPLARVNLIVGKSNAGKTALLEALELLLGNTGPETFLQPSFRSLGLADGSIASDELSQEVWRWQFNGRSLTEGCKIEACQTNHLKPIIKAQLQTKASPETHGYKPAYDWSSELFSWDKIKAAAECVKNFSGPRIQMSLVSTIRLSPGDLARRFDLWTLRTKNETRFMELLRAVDERCNAIRPKEHTGLRMLYANVGLNEYIALPNLGEGFNRLVQIFGAIIGEDADVVLIDELENGLHWSAFPNVWKGIHAAVDAEEVQIFATTHSHECLEAACETFKGSPEGTLAVHRLERGKDGEIHCRTIDQSALDRALERDWEVR